jgi:hypothetical protein
LREQLHAEALRRGLGQAAGARVIGDGTVWLWRLAGDRWSQVRQRLDYWHAVEHLAAAGRARLGEDTAAMNAWLGPLKRQLKNQAAAKIIGPLEDLLAELNEGSLVRETVVREMAYLRGHEHRMDYRRTQRRKEPLGSGAVEATGAQYQCRFKRPGQFWSPAGDDALLCLDTFWRNDSARLRSRVTLTFGALHVRSGFAGRSSVTPSFSGRGHPRPRQNWHLGKSNLGLMTATTDRAGGTGNLPAACLTGPVAGLEGRWPASR